MNKSYSAAISGILFDRFKNFADQAFYFFFDGCRLSSVKSYPCFEFINFSNEPKKPIRMITGLVKKRLQRVFYPAYITLLAKLERLKDSLVKSFSSGFYKKPHIKISHNDPPCYECIKRGGVCQPECEKRNKEEKK